MKKFLKPALLIFIAAGSFIVPAMADDTIAISSGSRLFEDLPLFAPWTNTSNPAALSTFSMANLNMAQAGYSHKKEDIRLYIQPESTSSLYAETRGYMKLGKLSLSGSFGYENDHYDGLMYNSTMMFNSLNPYIIGDTIPDTQIKEGFDLTGQASMRINERLSVAVGADYNAAIGSKQKDPRNRNNITSLRITPGMIYDLGKLKLGISGSVFTSSNEISFSVEGNWKRDLFILQGLGYYKDEPEISYYSELYSGTGYSAGIQASYETGSLINTAEFVFNSVKEEARSGSSYRLIDGIATTNSLIFSDMLRIGSGGAYHTISLNGTLSGMSGDEVLQRLYPVRKPTYSYDSLATVSWIEDKHLISDVRVNAGYRYTTLEGKSDIKSDMGGNIAFAYYSSGHYPLQTYGEMETMDLTLSAFINRAYTSGNTRITPGAEVSYRKNMGSSLSFKEQAQSIPEMVYSDFDALKTDLVSGRVSVRIEKFLVGKTVKSLYFLPRFDYIYAINEATETMTGYFIDATLGLTF